MEPERTYIAIDLKSFYASVECVERNMDPATTNLVVADESRTEKTICLAASLSMKAMGVPGRARLFEVIQKVREINEKRRKAAPGQKLIGESFDSEMLAENPVLSASYIVAKPRMAFYIKYSTDIYKIYLKYIAPDDIHVYSIDEVFIDATPYLKHYDMSAEKIARTIVKDIMISTGIIATAGIGTNLYLCKVALDILAKHAQPDEDGVRVAALDEMTYRKKLWSHTPITDFWRVGKGYAAKLDSVAIKTMGDIARCSLGKVTEYYNEDLLYKMFGVNAELLIDHAWGYESCTLADIKAYRPETKSLSSGQVLTAPYTFEKARLIVREMAENLTLDLTEKRLLCDKVVLTVGYEADENYEGESTRDAYGRKTPKHAHGTKSLKFPTSSTRVICDAAEELYDRVTNKKLLIRRLNVTCASLTPENAAKGPDTSVQLNLFSDTESQSEEIDRENDALEREKRLQEATVKIQQKYGKNAIIKGSDLEEGATKMERNEQIGGHRK
ncbi:MAG: DNA methylase [Clostridia bacterium]|nr:DNA methylase [Clostridia bacterium]